MLIDADACPVVKETLEFAREKKLVVYLVSNFNHEYFPTKDVKTITVDQSPEAADLALVNHSLTGDIVVTQDYGLACMLLGKRVKVISPRGRIFTNQNIESLMESRHLARKERKRRLGRGKGPSPFTQKDSLRFLRNLEKLLSPHSED